MTSPAAFTDADNWTGGFYELAIEVGETSDERLGWALGTLWRAACIRGCYGSCDREPPDLKTVPCTVESLERFGHLRGTVDLPGGLRTVCGAVAVREDRGPDWLDFYLPMGALARAEPRVGAFPFGNDGGNVSVTAWREPIDAWLSGVAAQVYTAVEYKLGLIGWEASGQVYAKDLDGATCRQRCRDAIPFGRKGPLHRVTRRPRTRRAGVRPPGWCRPPAGICHVRWYDPLLAVGGGVSCPRR